MTTHLTRAGLIRRSAVGGAVLLAGGAAYAPTAAIAATPDVDLSYLRLLVGVELLQLDFQTQALAGGKATGSFSRTLKQMQVDEQAHYAGLARLVAAAGQIPATADDIDFSYPKGTFASSGSILKQAAAIETLSVGAYLGAIENVTTPALRLPIGQIAANEAQHSGALAQLAGRPVIGRAFGPAWPIGAVSDALDRYES
jgi:hypothetical protein